ncbi:4,5-DOPA-extradiol-dioxygenase [Hylemonella gracilis]|uniref:Extradiol ring-cleavage dioxygenase III subunit B n=1 Tax=Hylemonella gracilis ATCC 19624 TaxID=887062 RepID=F3KP12_9BURK|nr:4,5-DOPA dioxygenase extradiol [Hylemonella gracilis]EGI78493.1 extradiol ring-cleavage dioxygenase III subunit B [Hylemonella gracilis ATCC 19624]
MSIFIPGLALEATDVAMPVLFIGHGSPMNVIEDNAYRRSWQALGADFGSGGRWPRPRLIVCISAHWLSEGWWLTGQARPRTIHDFGGFPAELFAQQYPAPGAPDAARAIADWLGDDWAVGVDDSVGEQGWGFDHGSWGVLKPMFPAADIPMVQLSMDYHRSPADHFALGARLAALRERGVLIVGSGNIVHNLRAARWGASDDSGAYDWARAFDAEIARRIEVGELAALANFQQLGDVARLSQPTHEHFLPLLYAAGAADARLDQVEFFNAGIQMASISMRSVIWSRGV